MEGAAGAAGRRWKKTREAEAGFRDCSRAAEGAAEEAGFRDCSRVEEEAAEELRSGVSTRLEAEEGSPTRREAEEGAAEELRSGVSTRLEAEEGSPTRREAEEEEEEEEEEAEWLGAADYPTRRAVAAAAAAGSQPASRHPSPRGTTSSDERMSPPHRRLWPFEPRSLFSSPPRVWRAIARRAPPFVARPPRRARLVRAPRIGSSSPPRREPRASPRPSPTRASTPTRRLARHHRHHARKRRIPGTDPTRKWTPTRVRRRRQPRPRSGSSDDATGEDPRARSVRLGTIRDATRRRRWTARSKPSSAHPRTFPRRRRRQPRRRRVARTNASTTPPTRRNRRADSGRVFPTATWTGTRATRRSRRSYRPSSRTRAAANTPTRRRGVERPTFRPTSPRDASIPRGGIRTGVPMHAAPRLHSQLYEGHPPEATRPSANRGERTRARPRVVPPHRRGPPFARRLVGRAIRGREWAAWTRASPPKTRAEAMGSAREKSPTPRGNRRRRGRR